MSERVLDECQEPASLWGAYHAGACGSVVNVSSVAATIPFPGIAGYSAIRVAATEPDHLGYAVRATALVLTRPEESHRTELSVALWAGTAHTDRVALV